MLSESARMSTAAEARFRIQTPNPTGRAVKALVETGITPPGVDPAHQKIRSASVVLPPDQPFKEGAREALIAHPGIAPASV